MKKSWEESLHNLVSTSEFSYIIIIFLKKKTVSTKLASGLLYELSSAQYEASKSVAKASDFEIARCNKEGDYLRHSIKLFLDALSSKSYEKLSFLKSHD